VNRQCYYIIMYIITTRTRARVRTKNRMSCCRKQRNVRGLAGRRAGGRVRRRYRRRTALAVAADAGPLCRHRHRWTCAITTWLHTHAHIIHYFNVCVRFALQSAHVQTPPARAVHNAFTAAATLQSLYYIYIHICIVVYYIVKP